MTARLNDDLRTLRARFYLNQWNEFDQELVNLPADVPQAEKDFWLRRANVERNLHAVATTQPPPNPDTNIAFQEHVFNLYALFVLSPQSQVRVQILEQLEAYLHQPPLYNNIILHIYGGLLFSKSNDKLAIAKDLLTRSSNPNPSIGECLEFLFEKLYIMVQLTLSRGLIAEAKQILAAMLELDGDDILCDLARLDIAVQTPSAKPDNDEDTELIGLAQDILTRYGPAIRPLIVQSSENLRQHNYKKAFTMLKQAQQLCAQQHIATPAEISINQLICLYYHGFAATLSSTQQTTGTVNFIQQQQQLEAMITKLEQDVLENYPRHPYFLQKATILQSIQQAIVNNNIPYDSPLLSVDSGTPNQNSEVTQ